MVDLEIEKDGLNNEQKKGLIWILNNAKGADDDEKLDMIRGQAAAIGYWTYRGSHHVAVHLMTAKGPENDRTAIFKAE